MSVPAMARHPKTASRPQATCALQRFVRRTTGRSEFTRGRRALFQVVTADAAVDRRDCRGTDA
jgi:hypothetical protein